MLTKFPPGTGVHPPQIPVIRSTSPGEALPAPLTAALQVSSGDLSWDTPWDFLNVPEQKTVRQFLQTKAAACLRMQSVV